MLRKERSQRYEPATNFNWSIPSGLLREFRDFPSYRVVRVVTKKMPVSVVDLSHVIDWLRHKSSKFRTKEKYENGNHVFAIFAKIWLDVLANGSENVPEETAIRGLMKADIPVLIPSSGESEESVIYRPMEESDFSRLVDTKILSEDIWNNVMANLDAVKRELNQFNSEVAERKRQFRSRIESLRSTLTEVESLI